MSDGSRRPSPLRSLVEPPPHLTRPDQRRRHVLIGWMYLAGMVLLAFFIPFDLFYTGYVHHALAEAVALVLISLAYAHYRRTASINVMAWVATVTVGVLILFLIASGRPNDTVAVWAPFYPAVPFFLLGARRGALSVAVFSIGLGGVLLWLVEQATPGLTTVSLFNALGATLGTAAILYYYEHGRAAAARTLEQAANTDFLTGVANRRHFQAMVDVEAARARRRHRPLTLLLVDLDHFKAVNDTHGHEVGDAVIRHCARVLVDGVRREDVVGRLGGEEFAVLLVETSEADGAAVADGLRRSLAAHPVREGLTVTASIGVAELRWGEDYSAAFATADRRLYAAKRAGRNRVVATDDPAQDADRTSAGRAAAE